MEKDEIAEKPPSDGIEGHDRRFFFLRLIHQRCYDHSMIDRSVYKCDLSNQQSAIKRDIEYWLSRTAEARLEAQLRYRYNPAISCVGEEIWE